MITAHQQANAAAREILPMAAAICDDLEHPSADCALRDIERATAILLPYFQSADKDRERLDWMPPGTRETIDAAMLSSTATEGRKP